MQVARPAQPPAPQRADDVCTAHPGRGAPLLGIRWVQNPHQRPRTPSVGAAYASGSSRAGPAAGTTRLGQAETCCSGKSICLTRLETQAEHVI